MFLFLGDSGVFGFLMMYWGNVLVISFIVLFIMLEVVPLSHHHQKSYASDYKAVTVYQMNVMNNKLYTLYS